MLVSWTAVLGTMIWAFARILSVQAAANRASDVHPVPDARPAPDGDGRV